MEKLYYDFNTEEILTETELKEEFIILVKNKDIEYNLSQFNLYINNCISKNGQLKEL